MQRSAPATRIPICVPPWDQSEALRLGARYDDGSGFTVAADAFLDDFWAWLPRRFQPDAPRPVLLPDMLPVSTWAQNVRETLGPDAWDRMRRHAYRAAGFRCEICGQSGRLEAHEYWQLENETCTQRLARIEALCPLCHKAHHLGIARRLGMFDDVQRHLKMVNGWNDGELRQAIEDAYEVWQQRCEMPWRVDLSWLQESGYIHV